MRGTSPATPNRRAGGHARPGRRDRPGHGRHHHQRQPVPGRGGNPGNQLQTGSGLFFKRAADAAWTPLPLLFLRTAGNNKYYAATIPRRHVPGRRCGPVLPPHRVRRPRHDLLARAKATRRHRRPTKLRRRPRRSPFPSRAAPCKGQWGPVFDLPNVAIHTHVLPNGLVLMWGRRDRPEQSLDVHECTPFLWNPVSGDSDPLQTHAAHAGGWDQRSIVLCGTRLPAGRPSAGGRRAFGRQRRREPGDTLRLDHQHVDAHRPDEQGAVVPDGDHLARRRRAGPRRQLQGERDRSCTTRSLRCGRTAPGRRSPRFPLATASWNSTLACTWLPMVGSSCLAHWSKRTCWTLERGQVDGGRLRALRQRDYCPAVMYDVDKVIYIGGGGAIGTRADRRG